MDDLAAHIRKLREDFSKGKLQEQDVDADPAVQFRTWMHQAAEARVPEPQAMNLSTVSADARPSSRIVYLREFGDNTFCFYTNYGSRKAQDLQLNPNAALTFFWPELERQVRIEGQVSRAPEAQSDAYYDLRPYESKIGAWASRQSAALALRSELEEKTAALKEEFTPQTIRRPPFWGGLVLRADYYEFWQGRRSRLHDRISYTLSENSWKISRLAP